MTKNEKVMIQFPITEAEYADIQRAKANSKDPRKTNKEFYREMMFKGLKAEKV